MEIPWEDALVPMKVYKIPLEYLVYNKYNGRILSRTKSLETQHQEIDATSAEGKKLISDLLWDSNEGRNKFTLRNIKEYGQQKVGIITRDGIIIDGNRRAMLLNKSGSFDYFKAVVLDVTLEENPLEIEKLETSFQMGEDEKVNYNPTEKYIKSKLLYEKLTNSSYSSDADRHTVDSDALRKISKWMGMGTDTSEIIRYLNTMEVMDEYLDHMEYQGIYTQLDKREDQFLSLTKWLKTYYGEASKKGFDGYTDLDVDDLKDIAFDYIRVQYEGKEFRVLAEGLRSKHFFGDRDIWENFVRFHNEHVEHIVEVEIDHGSENLAEHLNDRDKKFFKATIMSDGDSFLEENIRTHQDRLSYKRAAQEPQKLVDKAADALNAIDIGHESLSDPAVQQSVEMVANRISDIYQNSSPEKALDHVIGILSKMDLSNLQDIDNEIVLSRIEKLKAASTRLIDQLT